MNLNKVDQFELKFAVMPKGLSSVPGAHLLKLSVLINGLNVSPENVIDLEELIASLKSSGNFKIVTCVCGQAGCIGESQGVKVIHDSTKINWQIPTTNSYSHQLISMHTNKTEGVLIFQFETLKMQASIKTCLEEANCFLTETKEPIAYEPFGFNRSRLKELSLRI